MSNLDVALRLRMINQLSGPAKDAKRELEGIGSAAKKLDGGKADKLARDLGRTSVAAKGTERAVNQAAIGVRKLDAASTARLARQISIATFNSDKLASSLKRVRTEANATGAAGHTRATKALPYLAAGGIAAAGLGAVGAIYGGARVAGAVKQSFQDFAELDRRLTRLGITAEATKAQVEGATLKVREIARQYAVPVEDVLKGLESLVTQGKELPEALAMMDAITKSSQASGASAEDMANSAGVMLTNLKFKVEDLPTAFDQLAYAGKKGQFELRDMAKYLPELASNWANVGQEGIAKLADLAAATQIVRKQTGSAEKTFNGIRDLLTKIYSPEVERNFKKLGVDLPAGLKKGAKEGKPLLDVVTELTEKAIKGDLSQLPKLFGEIDSRAAISALINLKAELRSLRAEIQTKAAGTINNDIVQVTNDAQASIDRLSNSWSAAGIAVGKFVAEATPAVPLLESIARGIDGARSYFSGEDKKKGEPEKPRADEPAGPKSRFPGRMQSYEHARATREALTARRPKLSDFSGRFQSRDHARALEQWERQQRAFRTEHGAASPRKPDYSPVTSFKPPQIGHRKTSAPDPRNNSPVPPVAATVAETTMQRISRAVASESAKAVADSKSAAESIRAMWNFSVSPQISPRFGGAPGAPSSASPAPAAPPAPAPAPTGKRAAAGGGVHIVNNITVNGAGKNGRQIGSEVARELAKLGDSSSALFDTV